MTDVALQSSRLRVEQAPAAPASEVMFRFLGVDVLVVSANVGLLQHWSSVYGAFRVPPGPAAITVRVHGEHDGPPIPGQVLIEAADTSSTWWGDGEVFPPLAAPPLDAWVYLEAAAVCRAGQAVLVVGGPRTGKTVLALATVARGASLLADGVAPLDPVDLLLAPFPKAVRLRRDALSLLALEPAHPALTPFRTPSGAIEWRADVATLLGSRVCRVAAEVGGIAFLDPAAPGDEPRLEPIRPDGALLRLLGHLCQQPGDSGATSESLRRLCRQVPTYALRAGPLPAMARLVDQLMVD